MISKLELFVIAVGAVEYLLIGLLIAKLRWWVAFKKRNSVGHTILFPLEGTVRERFIDGFDGDQMFYGAGVMLSWPLCIAWNIISGILAIAITVFMFIVEILCRAFETAWQVVRSGAWSAYHFVHDRSKPVLIRRKILRLERRRKRLEDESSRRQYLLRGEIARNRIRRMALEQEINQLNDSLPARESPGGPYRSVKLRAVS